MDSIYNIIIELWKNLKLICYSHPVAASIIGGIFIVPLFITICGGTIANRNEGNRSRRRYLKEQLEIANNKFKLKEYNLALEEYLKLESSIKNKKKLTYILFKIGTCYYNIGRNNIDSEEYYKKAIYYYNKVIKLNKKIYEVFDSIANTYYQLSLIREKGENLRKSIELYEKAKKIYIKMNKRKYENKQGFIMLESDIATCYENLAEVGDSYNNLNYALKIYKSISQRNEYISCDIKWQVLHNLGRIYEKMAKINNRNDNLNQGLKYYKDALEIRDVERYPEDYALTNNNIGNVYLNLSEIEQEEENLKLALNFYNLALDVYDSQKYKRNYAMVKNNIGSVYRKLFKLTLNKEYLDESINNHIESLKQRNVRDNPIDYAYTCSNLGLAYSNRGEHSKNKEDLDLAITNFNKALEIFKSHNSAEKFISIKNNLGITYRLKGIFFGKKEDFEKSICIYEELLSTDSISKESYIYDSLLKNLIGSHGCYANTLNRNQKINYYNKVLNSISELKYQSIIKVYIADVNYAMYLDSNITSEEKKLLNYASTLYEEALNYFNIQNNTFYYAYSNKQLGLIYLQKGMSETSKKCFENALQVFTEVEYPDEYKEINAGLELLK